uniref:calycin-like domain-containing protein n=1 Tax=Candidatus Limisoma sp. TaxID=3076476 RepID=UPI003FEF8C52
MKKFYALLLMVFAVAMGVSAQTYYNGKLDVEMVGEKIADGMDARVSLSESADGTYVFKLPDFRITINETELPCGDIVVEGVTRKDGKLSGSVNDLSLAMGQIHAKVDLVGTETAEGAMDLAITVGWYTDYPDDLSATMPINVTFKGQRDAGVNVVEASGAEVRGAEGAIAVDGFAGRVNVYTVDGRLAASAQVDGEATISVAAGLYVVRAGEKAVKVVVK